MSAKRASLRFRLERREAMALEEVASLLGVHPTLLLEIVVLYWLREWTDPECLGSAGRFCSEQSP